MIVMLDQSKSMAEDWGDDGSTKADVLADTVNELLATAVVRCTSGSDVRDRFEIGLLGYRNDVVCDILDESSSASPGWRLSLRPISEIAKKPLRIEDRVQTVEDRNGQMREAPYKMPIWLEPEAVGSTPMSAAFMAVIDAADRWVESHRKSFPPLVFNITDAAATDGNPEELAGQLRSLETQDGTTLLFNIHVSQSAHRSLIFPQSDQSLSGDHYAALLYRMSSVLPASMVRAAKDAGIEAGPSSRAFAHNADPANLIEVLDVGSVPLLGPNVFSSKR